MLWSLYVSQPDSYSFGGDRELQRCVAFECSDFFGETTSTCYFHKMVYSTSRFYESKIIKEGALDHFSPYLGREPIIRLFAVMQFAIGALTALGNEMFRFTNKTKGGLILMMVFFYSAYVFGAALWVETGEQIAACATLGGCAYTMMRLTFYDGTGFDYAFALTTHNHNFLFALVMIYMCLTAFGILNGLVGLFGTAFNRASYMAFDRLDEDAADSGRSADKNDGDRDDKQVDTRIVVDPDPNCPPPLIPGDLDTVDSSQLDAGGYQPVSGASDLEANLPKPPSPASVGPNITVRPSRRGRSSQFDLFEDFDRARSSRHSQQPPQPHPDTLAVMALVEAKFGAMNEHIVRLLHNQSLLQHEVARLSAAQGVSPAMVVDGSGHLSPAKPPKKRFFFQKPAKPPKTVLPAPDPESPRWSVEPLNPLPPVGSFRSVADADSPEKRPAAEDSDQQQQQPE